MIALLVQKDINTLYHTEQKSRHIKCL